jgi:hypothetical protein
MKARTWRQYFGYRPQTLAELGRLTDAQIDAQAAAYRRWLIDTKRVTLDKTDLVKAETDAEAVESAQKWLEECLGRLRQKRRSEKLRRMVRAAQEQLDAAQEALSMSSETLSELLEEKAREYCRTMEREPVIAASDPDKKRKIRETVDCINDRCFIRAVRCTTAVRSWQEWGLPLNHDGRPHLLWPGGPAEPYWFRCAKADAPTTYGVWIDGRCVNSFLSRGGAKRWALEKLQA